MTDLEDLLDRIASADSNKDTVAVAAVLREAGDRSFGAILLTAGLVILAPVVGDIPIVPVLMGLVVALTASQLLCGRDHFWLPDWLLKRSVARKRLCKGLKYLRRPARFVDRFVRPRLVMLLNPVGHRIIAAICLLIAVATPAMELVPFSANGAGAVFSLFGLSIVVRDGVLVLLALAVVAMTGVAIGYGLT